MRLTASLVTVGKRFGASRLCRWLIAVCLVAVVASGAAVAMTVSNAQLIVEVTCLLVAGVGGLLAHEFGHALAYQVVYPDGDWDLQANGATFAIVAEESASGLALAGVSAAGPLAGAIVAFAPSLIAFDTGVYTLMALLHLMMLTPLSSDGRQIVSGLRQWSSTGPRGEK